MTTVLVTVSVLNEYVVIVVDANELRNRGCTGKFLIHDAGSEISLTSLDDVMMSL
jgi:hypothetical protein